MQGVKRVKYPMGMPYGETDYHIRKAGTKAVLKW